MLALLYLIVMVVLGDSLCRRFCPCVSRPHRFAAAFLVGLIVSTWMTYLSARAFASSSRPLLMGNILFFAIAIGLILWLRRRRTAVGGTSEAQLSIPATDDKRDWIAIGLLFVLASWMMFSSFNMDAGKLQIANHQWSDFGPNVAIMQSFALGHNFPTEYPHFSGDRIRYHFLFYFQAGNLEYLGLNAAWSNNLLSVLSLVSMLILVKELGHLLFQSRAVGWLGAALFFFHGSLNYFHFLRQKGSIAQAVSELTLMQGFLTSGFPYRGEDWGVWSLVNFVNQRHFASAIGIFLLVILFLVTRYRDAIADQNAEVPSGKVHAPSQTRRKSGKNKVSRGQVEPFLRWMKQRFKQSGGLIFLGCLIGIWSLVKFVNQSNFAGAMGIGLLVILFLFARYRSAIADQVAKVMSHKVHEPSSKASKVSSKAPGSPPLLDRFLAVKQWLRRAGGFIFLGGLIGLLPMWNGAVFIAAVAVLGVLFILFPLKKEMLALALTAGLVALPQVIYLKTGNVHAAGYSLFHWGYTLDNPTPLNTLKYLGWTFGFKWLAIAVAVFLATSFQLRVMIAISSLLAVAFLFQFSEELLANHKFLNIWLIVVNLFVAFGLWRLWHMAVKGNTLAGKVSAVSLVVVITLGGIMDLFPIRNSYWVEIPFESDRLVRWVKDETDPKAIFLTDRFVTHRILLAGRRIFHGWPYYTWGAGYLAPERDVVYKRLFEEKNPQTLMNLLRENSIAYVAIDNGVRRGGFIKNVNEKIYETNFQKVFQDTDNQYDALSIFRVPADGQLAAISPSTATANQTSPQEPVSAFEGGTGKGHGEFDKPRGVTVDASGNVYVADGGNSRIQKFSPEGKFLGSYGRVGTGDGELREPDGVAVDASGNIYVTDAVNQRLVKFNSDGNFVGQWRGPEPGFAGPRDIAVGPDKLIYVLDQGRARVVKMNSKGETVGHWGQSGSGDGQFNNPTGLAVSGERVYVADAGNNRIQIFDVDGKFINQWFVPQWDKYIWHFPDLAVDENESRVYVTSGWTKEVLVLDMSGNYVESIKPDKQQEFNNVSSIVVSNRKSGKRLYVLNTGTYAVESGPPSVSLFELGSKRSN